MFFSGKGNKKLPAYRPCYGQLGEMRSLVGGDVPVIALTATATKATREIIINDLCMKNCLEIILNPEKANFKYSVENCGDDMSENFKWLLDLLYLHGSKCPRIIVFFRQIKQITEVYEYLETHLEMKQFASTEETTKMATGIEYSQCFISPQVKKLSGKFANLFKMKMDV